MHFLPLLCLLCFAASSCNQPRRTESPEKKSPDGQACPPSGSTGEVVIAKMLIAYRGTTQYSDQGKVLDESDSTRTGEIRFRTDFQGSGPTGYTLNFDFGPARFGTRENTAPWGQRLILESGSSQFNSVFGVEKNKHTTPGAAISTMAPMSAMAVEVIPLLLSLGVPPYVREPSNWAGGGVETINKIRTCKLIGESEERKIQIWIGRDDGLIRRAILSDLVTGSTRQIDYIEIRQNQKERTGSGALFGGPVGSFLPKHDLPNDCPVLSGDWCFWRFEDACAAACPGLSCSTLTASFPPQIICNQRQ